MCRFATRFRACPCAGDSPRCEPSPQQRAGGRFQPRQFTSSVTRTRTLAASFRSSQRRLRATSDTSDRRGVDVPVTQPRLSYLLLAINLSVYAAGVVIALTVSNEASNDFFLLLAKDNAHVTAGEWWRLLSANFMHAGLLHLGVNCAALYAVAPETEAAFGYGTFLAIYLLSGLAGSVSSYAFNELVTVGASGAIFGLLGALAAYFVRNPSLNRSSQQLLYIAAVVGVNVILGLGGDGLVDNTGHIAGLVAGFYVGFGTSPRYDVVHTRSTRDNVRIAEAECADSSTDDAANDSAQQPSTAIEVTLARLAQLSSTDDPVLDKQAVEMSLEEDAVLSVTVIDRTSNAERVRVVVSFGMCLLVATAAATLTRSTGSQG